MINMHTHTHHSDGVLSPEELLLKLYENNIEIAAITDHDNVDAHIKIKDKQITTSIILIPGVEMKCTSNAYSIEILGYFIDINLLKKYLDDKNKKIIEFQEYAFEIGKKVCKNLNLKFDDIPIEKGVFAGTALFDLLNKYIDHNSKILGEDILSSNSSFYRRTYANPGSLFYVSEENLGFTTKDTVFKIHEAGGLAFVAHTGQYKMIENKLEFLSDLKNKSEIDGIECYYPLHTLKETQEYINFCKDNNLLISSGTDFHGTPSQNIIIPQNVDEKDLLWLKRRLL